MLAYRVLGRFQRALNRLRGERRDYRDHLFEHLKARLGGRHPESVLEIGPRDGEDTRRLVTLAPRRLVLADLPHAKEGLEAKLAAAGLADSVERRYGNVMYDAMLDDALPFDLIWCTGVLYHNPEQLRMIVRLFDWLAPDGLLVLETATARRPGNRDRALVEIWHGEPGSTHARHHLSPNITHLPSRKAVQAWLAMAGFAEIEHSDCHRRQLWTLSRNRAAYICRRPRDAVADTYYRKTEENYPVGRAL